jgi:hypothetical protein
LHCHHLLSLCCTKAVASRTPDRFAAITPPNSSAVTTEYVLGPSFKTPELCAQADLNEGR